MAVQLAAVLGTLYPNLATNEVAVRFSAPASGEVQYTILNSAGQVVQQGSQFATNELQISVANLPANNLYLLRVGNRTYRFSK